MTEQAMAIRIRRIGWCKSTSDMRRSGEDAINAGEQKAERRSRRQSRRRRRKQQMAGYLSKSTMPRPVRKKTSREGSRRGKETKCASSGSRAIPEAAIALLRQAATCDKPLTSLLRRRERSASQDVVGQRAGWVSERTLGQDMSLTHAVRHHRFTLAVPHRLLPLDTSPVTGSVFLGPVLSIVDFRLSTVACRLPLAACRRPLVAWTVATPSIRAIRAIRAQPPEFAPGPGYEGCLYRMLASGAREYCVPG
jgi:hypothetical protein